MQLTKYNGKFFSYLILSVCLVMPFANDGYITSLPHMAVYFSTKHTQLIMSIFMFGSAISQIFYGPFLDRFGRKPVLVVGLSVYCIGSLITICAYSFEIMLIGRIIQAIGASSCIVSTLTIVKDIYPQEQLIAMTSFIMGIIAICPNLAPIIGGLLESIGGWRLSFSLFLVMGIFYLIIISTFLNETHKEKNLQALKFKQILITYYQLVKHKKYFGYLATSSCSYGVLFSYFSMAPFLIMYLFKIKVEWVGIIIALNSIPLLITPYIYPHIIKNSNPSRSVIIGSKIIWLGAIIMLLIHLIIPHNIFSLIGPMFMSSIGIGVIRPNASAGYMQLIDKKFSGSASALFGLFSFLGSAIFTSITTLLTTNSVLPFAYFIVVIASLSYLSSKLTSQ